MDTIDGSDQKTEREWKEVPEAQLRVVLPPGFEEVSPQEKQERASYAAFVARGQRPHGKATFGVITRPTFSAIEQPEWFDFHVMTIKDSEELLAPSAKFTVLERGLHDIHDVPCGRIVAELSVAQKPVYRALIYLVPIRSGLAVLEYSCDPPDWEEALPLFEEAAQLTQGAERYRSNFRMGPGFVWGMRLQHRWSVIRRRHPLLVSLIPPLVGLVLAILLYEGCSAIWRAL